MASSTQPQKAFSKIFDATRVSIKSVLRDRAVIPRDTIVQGQLRHPNSNAFKEHRFRETVRFQKALNSVSHGRHIFAYQHLRTKQVVYSLTRHLEENNVLRQLVYHGKKTVPAELRPDMWAPHYSVHFGDARLGLRAYRLLREFSMQRQLAPPPELITVTEEYLAARRPREPVEAEEYDKKNRKRIGQFMHKRERAKVLMNQKATSIADVAAVLSIQDEEIKNGLLEKEYERGYLGPAARRRRREARLREQKIAEAHAARVATMEKSLEAHITDQIDRYPQQPDQIKILWQDVHDANYAESWPDRVEHGELAARRGFIMGPEKFRRGSTNVAAKAEAEPQGEQKKE